MASGEKLTRSLAALLLLLVVGLLSGQVGALTVDDLYPFGSANGDTILPLNWLSSDLIPLPHPVPVFGVAGVSGAYLNLNGALHFDASNTDSSSIGRPFPTTGLGYSMVAAFWTDLVVAFEYDDGYPKDCKDDACNGVAYRAVDDAALLADITSDIRGALPNEALAAGFTAESALIATWFNVSQFFEPDGPKNTFQAVIAFNTRTVFVGLLYPKLTFREPLGLQAGFNLNDGVRSFRLPTSFSTTSFDELSNTGEAGKWWFGLDSSDPTIGTFNYVEPVTYGVCELRPLFGDTGVDACGNKQTMDWDFNNDGNFDDATGTTDPLIDTSALRLTPGTYPISAQVRSASPCPGAPSDPLVLNTTLTLTDSPPIIFFINVDPATGNRNPYVGEAVSVIAPSSEDSCNDFTKTIDCGLDSTEGEPDGICRYSTAGVKTITVTLTQNGVTVSKTIDIVVVEYKQACSPAQYFPNGRATGQRGCSPNQWASSFYSCNYPVRAGIKPSTKLWTAFASRAPEDAAIIRRFYGNRTMAEALGKHNHNQADMLASEAAAALLNAITLPYSQCPSTVKLQFRHALYHGPSSAEARSLYKTFHRQNNVYDGCRLPRVPCNP